MDPQKLTKLSLRNFTAFSKLDIEFSPGINIFVGANGTGKTHILKLLYAVCDVTRTGANLGEKLVWVFLPNQRRIGRLTHRARLKRQQANHVKTLIEVYRGKDRKICISFSSQTTEASSVRPTEVSGWFDDRLECTYISSKEMLSHAPGFRSLYARREIHFDETYADIVDRAYLPASREVTEAKQDKRSELLEMLQKAMGGKVTTKGEEFFLRNKMGVLEFTLLAEGFRKLALLWLLVQNGTLQNGSLLFWDEPEANLNPKIMGTVVDVLLELQRMGVQVFLATHNYVILKEFDLRRKEGDQVKYHALFYDSATGEVALHSTADYSSIHSNAIADTFMDLYDRDVERAIGRRTEG